MTTSYEIGSVGGRFNGIKPRHEEKAPAKVGGRYIACGWSDEYQCNLRVIAGNRYSG
jgi:hypothetical protein